MLSELNKQRKKEILDWLEIAIENGRVEDKMQMYCPNVEVCLSVDLSDPSVPKAIMERVSAKYYTKDEICQ